MPQYLSFIISIHYLGKPEHDKLDQFLKLHIWLVAQVPKDQ